MKCIKSAQPAFTCHPMLNPHSLFQFSNPYLQFPTPIRDLISHPNIQTLSQILILNSNSNNQVHHYHNKCNLAVT